MFSSARVFPVHLGGVSAVLLALIGSAAIATPAIAGVPLAWARVRASRHQVDLVSASGVSRPASVTDCFCPGETLSTAAAAQAEVLFSDGSLARIGEQAHLQFWPDTRNLRLSQGTVALFVSPSQGRTTLQSPNAAVGINSSGVVVRHVPSRRLTLVMALANSPTGPVSITVTTTGQEFVLHAGQMAFIGADTLQVVEFDLLEFYQTSNLVAGLELANPNYRPAADEPVAALRPHLLQALHQQAPFSSNDAILDPSLINGFAAEANVQSAESVVLPSPTEELRRYSETPPGVVVPLAGDAAEPMAPAEPLAPAAPGLPTEAISPAGAVDDNEYLFSDRQDLRTYP